LPNLADALEAYIDPGSVLVGSLRREQGTTGMTSTTLHVYLAGRSEDVDAVRTLRERLGAVGIACTSSWLTKFDESERVGALRCLMDIARADALVLVNLSRVHRSGTGGRHVETGVALTLGKPVVVLGSRENVFHHLGAVWCVDPRDGLASLEAAIREAVATTPSSDTTEHRRALGLSKGPA
jgi:nucleoside 2-deoxyribosyltransferase